MGATMTDAQQLRVKLLNAGAKVPEYGSEEAAGADLFANLSAGEPGVLAMATIAPGTRMLIKTGVAVELNPGTYAEIAPRSGLAYKQGVAVLGGIIDSDYRGDIGVILHNTSDKDVNIMQGDRIAQLIIKPYIRGVFAVAESLDDTVRGEGGFGSTGK